MRTIIAVGLAGMIFAGPALAQNTDNRVNSGAGVPGQPGNKSGPPAYRYQNTGQASPDQSKVLGQLRQQIWARYIASEGDEVGEAASY
jgi:hypothetical protein